MLITKRLAGEKEMGTLGPVHLGTGWGFALLVVGVGVYWEHLKKKRLGDTKKAKGSDGGGGALTRQRSTTMVRGGIKHVHCQDDSSDEAEEIDNFVDRKEFGSKKDPSPAKFETKGQP